MRQVEQIEPRLNFYKKISILLGILLCIVLAALFGLKIYSYFSRQKAVYVAPDNIITIETKGLENSPSNSRNLLFGASTDLNGSVLKLSNEKTDNLAAGFLLSAKKPKYNVPFQSLNLFPGDSETKYYSVKFTYKNTITIRFRADIHPGSEKLAEVLKCKVVLLSTGQVMYDGLMRDMPKSLNYTLTSPKKTTSEALYEITTYHDTSVGNDYQEKELRADFVWWVEEVQNLNPKTGVLANPLLPAVLFASLLALGVLGVGHRKGARV